MSANSETASGWARLPVAPLAFRPPRGSAASLAALGPVVTARLKARQFLDALRGTRRKPPAGSGGSGEPPQAGPAPFSHWDDPALWMLMMH